MRLGASASDMGWFQSSSNLSNNIMQVFWGRLSDRTGLRVPFIVLGSTILSALWIPMMFVGNAAQLIVLLAVQALVGSMATPAWTALIGDLVPSLRLGRANASVNLWSAIGSVAATLASGIIMWAIGGSVHQIFMIPLAIAAVCGISSSLAILKVKEQKNGEKIKLRQNLTSDILQIFLLAKRTPRFARCCFVVGTFELFMSLSWPLFAVTEIRVLDASMLQLALLSVGQLVVRIAFQGWAGRLADTSGRRKLMILFRFSLVTVPLAYALAPDINTLLLVSLYWGFANALGTASVTAYLLDITPEEHRGSFIALFNLVLGTVAFAGSLLGGYLSDYTISLFGLVGGLQVVYLISIIGRGVGAALHFTLEETLR